MAKEIDLEDKVENIGAQMVKQVASKTSDVVGDGTTTATSLAQAIYREGSKLVAAGSNPMAIKRGIEKSVDLVIEELKKMSKPTKDKEEIAQVGTISANVVEKPKKKKRETASMPSKDMYYPCPATKKKKMGSKGYRDKESQHGETTFFQQI